MEAAGNTTGISDEAIQWSHPNITYAIIISVGAGLATGIGGSLVFVPDLMRRVPQATVLAISLALSAGVMIYVSFIEIFVKSYEAIAETEGVSEAAAAGITTGCFFAGMLFCALLEMLVHYMTKSADPGMVCAAHAELPGAGQVSSTSEEPSCGTCGAPEGLESGETRGTVEVEIIDGKASDAKSGAPEALAEGELIGNPETTGALSRMGLMTALAIAIHNFPEGLATFLATLEDTKLGASLGVAIAVHNIPEGLCVAMPIYYASGSKFKAFGWSLLSGITEPLGGIVGFAVLQPVFSKMVFGIVFAAVGGMMVFIVCHELLPAAHKYMANGAKTTMWLIIGMVIMAVSLVLFVI